MKALLTGGSSFTGYWFAKALRDRGIKVVAALRGDPSEYKGVRAERVKALANLASIVPNAAFGSPNFCYLIENNEFNVLCHHGAEVGDYRNPDFDFSAALAANTRNGRALVEALANKKCHAMIATGSVFEPNEGAGTEPLNAFSPYALSKFFTGEAFRYWCQTYDMPFGKFVIPNPFGPFEEPRFCAYLIKTWVSGAIADVRTPLYVRDNIHVELLAKDYANFVVTIVKEGKNGRRAPTGYVETQGTFAERFANEMRPRLKIDCRLSFSDQTEFSEPLTRINTDQVDYTSFGWDEAAAWDAIAKSYQAKSYQVASADGLA